MNTHPDTSPEQSSPPTTARRRPIALAVGITAVAVALAGAAFVSMPSTATAEDAAHMPRMQGHDAGQMRGAERMQRPHHDAPAQRAAHIEELAVELGVDAAVLGATMEALHADMDVERDAMRATLMELEPAARQAAMRAFADERRAVMAGALEGLGVDPAALAALQAEHRAEHGPEHGPEHGAQRGPQQHRGGASMRG